MEARVLVIQFRLKDRTIFKRQPVERALEGESCSVTFKNAVAGEIDLTEPERELAGFDAVILSGSSDLFFDGGYSEAHEGRVQASRLAEQAQPFARYLIDNHIPTLGICFGHQLLGYTAGAPVRYSPQEGKTGTHTVLLTQEGENDPLMRGVPRSFAAHYGHKDALCDCPEGAVVLACNQERCRFSALRFADGIYGVQFHPEFSQEEISALIRKCPGYVPEGQAPEGLFDDAREAERVLKNFIALATRG